MSVNSTSPVWASAATQAAICTAMPMTFDGSSKTSPMVESLTIAQPLSLTVTEALGQQRAQELRARGADMDWDEAVAYTLTQTTQALNELKSGTQP